MASALQAHKFESTQARYDEYEIQSISLYDGLHNLTTRELSFYKKLNKLLPSIQSKQQAFIDNINLNQIIKDYNLYLTALANNKQEMDDLNIDISFEIDLIWRVHILSTNDYENDCNFKFGKIIDYKYNSNINDLHLDSEGFRNILSSVIDINEYDLNKNFISIDLGTFKNMIYEYIRFITNFEEYSIYDQNLFDFQKCMTRYRYFMYLKYISSDNNIANSIHLIPTSDVLLLWYCHIIYSPSNYLTFSKQLFNLNHMLKYQFFTLRKIENDDILQTQNLWENYFGKFSYRDYSFMNFVFDDSVLSQNNAKDNDMSGGGGGGEGNANNNIVYQVDNGQVGYNHHHNMDKDGNRDHFCYDRENRKCILCMSVITVEVIIVIICILIYLFDGSLVITLIVLFVATLLLIGIVFFVANQDCCLTDDEDAENARIEQQVRQYQEGGYGVEIQEI